jgi:hypothetical protein
MGQRQRSRLLTLQMSSVSTKALRRLVGGFLRACEEHGAGRRGRIHASQTVAGGMTAIVQVRVDNEERFAELRSVYLEKHTVYV